MKKIFLAVAAMAMLATACTKDDSAVVGNESLVSFTIDSPELATRYGEGTTATNLEWAFYDEDGEKLNAISGSINNFSGVHTFDVSLVEGRQYTALFWASAPNAPYTVDWAGKTMTIDNTNLTANNEAYDAFYNYSPIDPTKKTHKIELTRPFAQINIATADTTAATAAGVTVATTQVAVVQSYKTLDFINGAVSDKADFTFKSATKATGTVTVGGKGYDMLAMNYVLVNARELVNVTMLASENADGTSPITREYTTVPVQRNYKTYIVGNLLTTSNDFNIEVEEDFNDTTLPETAIEKLIMDIQTVGGEFTLPSDITLKGTLELRHDVVLDLGGHTIDVALAEGSTTNHIYAFENHAKLTLKNGTVNARGIFNYGNMIVENATINAIDGNGGYGVRNYEGATFTMNSGTIATTLEDDNQVNNGGYDATTLRVDEGATTVINGGTINNICDYTYAIDNAGGEVIVNGGEIKSIHSTVSNYGTMTINGGSFTCNGIDGITAHALVAWNGSTTTINGGTFDGKDNYNGFNVDAGNGAVVYIHGGEFKNVHSGSLYGEGTITVDGGQFFDNPASRLATGYKAVAADGAYVVVPETVGEFTAVTESTTDFATAIATSNGEKTMFEWEDVYYVAEYEKVSIYPATDAAITVRGIVEGSAIKEATIAEGVTEVGSRTFRKCGELETVVLPSSLTEIGPSVFQSCGKLSSIVLPASVQTIGEGAFAECVSLSSINIPAGVTRIEKDALRNTGLVSVEFPESVTYFGTYAFRDCEKLSEVIINAPSFTVENNTFTNMAAPVPTITIKVVNEEMKAYLESVLTSYDKSYITVVVM